MLLPLALFAALYLPQTADVTSPPATAHLRYTALAHGVQIYRCAAQDSGFQWVFESPEADLVDAATQQPVAKHGAGPSWTWSDGSAITGKVLQKHASSDAANIPWLLLETHSTGRSRGRFQRSRSCGGRTRREAWLRLQAAMRNTRARRCGYRMRRRIRSTRSLDKGLALDAEI